MRKFLVLVVILVFVFPLQAQLSFNWSGANWSMLNGLMQQMNKAQLRLSESDVVYVVPGEKVFHLEGCEKLGSSKTGMSVRHAREVREYEPCSECILSKGITLYRVPIDSTILEDMQEARRAYVATKVEMGKMLQRVKDAILRGDVLIGMISSDVIASRGRPHDVNKTTTKFGINEQWVMYAFNDSGLWDLKGKEYGYIYFENGLVTSWQSR
ncbi:hypothetical protein ES703_11836 [subsurface metagenome]